MVPGTSASGVLSTRVDEDTAGAEAGADEGGTMAVEVGSSGVELGAEGLTLTVDEVSSGVELGAEEELDKMTSGVVSTGLLDEGGTEETAAGLSSGAGSENDENTGGGAREGAREGGASGLPVERGGCGF